MITVCGCFYEDQDGGRTVTRHLPQAKVDVHSTILATAYSTELNQTFKNPSQERAIPECRYVFPLYDGVSVIKFDCVVDSRVIQGVVKEKVEAKEIYSAAVSRGETAGLLEQGPTSDVFATTLGNIPPDSEVRVHLTYVGELKHDLAAEGIRYTLPTYISPRYGSGAPQGNDLSSYAGAISILVDITMPAECPILEVRSPSHPISLSLGRTSVQSGDSINPCQASSTLSLGETSLDKDFVLEVRHRDGGGPRALLEYHPTLQGHRALMTTLVPASPGIAEMRPELIIVADQSGSMNGARTETLVKALRILLRSLPLDIKFNVIAYGSGHTFLWKKSKLYNEKALNEALKFVNAFNASHGGTETWSAVRAAIDSRDSDQDLALFMATDGDIWNSGGLFQYLSDEVSNSKKALRVFPLGIGSSVSSSFVEGVARAGNGFGQSVGEGEQYESKIMRMLKGALTPDSGGFTMEVHYEKDTDEDEYDFVERVTDSLQILSIDEVETLNPVLDRSDTNPKQDSVSNPNLQEQDMQDAQAPSSKQEVAPPKLLQTPQTVPPLYPSTRTNIYLLLSPEASDLIPKTVIFRNERTEAPVEIVIPVEVVKDTGTTIHSLAAKRAMLELEEGRGWLTHARRPDGRLLKEIHTPEFFTNLIKNEAVRLGVQFQLTGKYTSSVAVESNADAMTDGDTEPTEREITISPSPEGNQGSSSAIQLGVDRRMSSVSKGKAASQVISRSSLIELAAKMSASAPRKQLASKAARKAVPQAPPPPPPSAAYSRTKARPQHRGGRGGPSALPSHLDVGKLSEAGDSATRYRSASTDSAFVTKSEPGQIDVVMDGIDSYEASEENDNDNANKEEALHKLLSKQSFSGTWDLQDVTSFLSTLGLARGTIATTTSPAGCTDAIWATLLALMFLEEKYASQKDVWEMQAQKSWTWLSNNTSTLTSSSGGGGGSGGAAATSGGRTLRSRDKGKGKEQEAGSTVDSTSGRVQEWKDLARKVVSA